MTLTVTTPVVAGQAALCTVIGNNELGTLTLSIKIGGNGSASARPVENPDPTGGRDVKALPAPGNTVGIRADPPWQSGDQVTFELRDATKAIVSSQTTVVL